MPRYQEKKYLVDSFKDIEKLLVTLNAKPVETSSSVHYYAQLQLPGVTKLVVHNDHSAIHILDDDNGKFTLRENIPVNNKAAGLRWLQTKGFNDVCVITMAHTDYEHKDGIVGLYLINKSLRSVILAYPPGQHDAIAKELGLAHAEVISLPYNVYLQKQGRLESVKIESLLVVSLATLGEVLNGLD